MSENTQTTTTPEKQGLSFHHGEIKIQRIQPKQQETTLQDKGGRIEEISDTFSKSVKKRDFEGSDDIAPKYELDLKQNDEVWFVIDTDEWGNKIISLKDDCNTKQSWNVAQSNPCFEIWLYYHFYYRFVVLIYPFVHFQLFELYQFLF